MHGPRLVLVHSPLTGPSFWSGVRDALWRSGVRAYLARLPEADRIHPPYWLTHAAGVAAALPDDGEVVLVAHSGAGPLLPAIGRLARNRDGGARVTGYLFVDCDLPRDGCSRLDLFSDPAAAEALRGRCREGWLPRWREADLMALLPDDDQRRGFVAELPRTPLAVYEELISVPEGWPDAPCGYLELSAHYPQAVAFVQAAAWPQRRIGGHHLAPLTDPAAVAAALIDLASELAAAAGQPGARSATSRNP